jgi:hypothetical protein
LGRLTTAVGKKIGHSQLNDVLLATFVILPCILPTFGPPAGGLAGTAIAIAACAIGLTLFYTRWQPITPEFCWGGVAAVFIAVFGATSLLQFTDFSMAIAAGTISWNYGPLWFVKGVGSAYQAATGNAHTGNPASFAELIGPTIVSVGLFEESLKLLPALIAAATKQVTRPAGLLFIGATSGLAFGIAEGIWMLAHYRGEPTLSHVMVRLFGGSACHAVLASLTVLLFLAIRRRFNLRPVVAVELLMAIAASFATATVHGLYDTLLAVNLRQAAGFVMSGLIITLLMVDRHGELGENVLPQAA